MRSTPRHVAIFDFDCTLTRFHVWGKFRALPLAQIPIDKATFVDSDAFARFVGQARSCGADVAIATFGRHDVVDKALKVALGTESHGIEISTPADHFDPRFDATSDDERPRCAEGSDILGDKNAQIDELCLRFGVTRQHVSLIDDDANNVACARSEGIWAEHTPQGCDADVLESILARIRR